MKNLSSNKLLDILKTIPYKNYKDHGALISFGDISLKLRYDYNFDNADLLTLLLNDLESNNLIETVKMIGFDDNMILGIKIK